MLKFIDEKGMEHLAQAEINVTNGVNGERSISGIIFSNDSAIHSIGRGWKLVHEDEFYCLTYALPVDEGEDVYVEFDAVHEFFYDFQKSVIHKELNGSHTFDAYLKFIFDGTEYKYRVETNIAAFEKESFGFKNRWSLFKDIIESVGVEFVVNGKVVRILKRVGTDLSTVVKKGFNLQELKLEHDIGSFITFKKGYGAYFDNDDESKGRLEVEYLSPLAELFGKLEGDPIIDERYTVKESLLSRLKNDVDNSYSIAISLTMEDLNQAGYKQDRPVAGDYIMAINDDIGFRQRVRIVSFTSSYDVDGNLIEHQIDCNSLSMSKISYFTEDNWRKEIESGLENALKDINHALISADGKNLIFYGLFGENSEGEPKAVNVGDMWYKPVGEETVFYIWDGKSWLELMSTVDNKIIKEELEQMEIEVQAAKDKADEVALSLVDVQKDEDEAKASAEQSKVDAGNAMVNASKVMSEANRALSRTNENKTSISGLTVKMDEVNANLELKATKQDLSKLDGTLKNHQTQITQNTTDIKTRANQTEVNTLKGTVTKQQTEIAQNATDIKRKAEKTVVDTINNMVKNHQTLISQNSEAVKIKADKSEVNNLERNVTKLQSTINLEAGKITNLTSNVNENSTNIGKLTIESNKISSQVVELQNQEISTQNFFPYSFVEPSFTINQNELTHNGTWAGPVVNNNNLRKMRLVGGEKYRIKYQFRLDEDPSSYIPFQQAQHGTLLFYSGVDHSKYPSIALGGTHNNVEDAKTWKKGTIVDREAVFVMPKDISPQTQYRIIGYTFRAMNKDGSFAKLLKGTFLNVTIQKGDVFTGWTPAPEDMATQSQITQLSDDILLRVKKGEIINQINVSSEGILIDGTKTHITGKTRIDNAVIKNAMIADGAISNAKIQNAAITSAKIAQLDAGKITFGTLSGITISGANSYWNLSNGLFKMTNPSNSGQYIQIQNGKFSSFNGASKQISIQNDELAATSGSKKIALNPERLTFTGEGYHRTVELQGQGITISSLGQPNVGANYLNAGIEIESKGTQAYIDFRTGGRKNDFDARIKSVDGNNTNGQGTLQFEAKEVQVMSPTFKLRGTNSIDFNGATAISAPKNMIMTALNGDNSVLSIEKAGSHSNHYFNFRMRGLNHGIKDWGVSTWASDERLKRNIAPTKLSGKGLINRLNVVEFDWKTDGYHEPMGLIAQEVEKILPNAVFENLSDIKQLRSEAFIPVLIKAVQELKGDIDRISRQVVDLQLMRIGE